MNHLGLRVYLTAVALWVSSPDVGIALLLFCNRIGIDLLDAIKDKMVVNRRNYPLELSKGKAKRPA